MAESGFSRARLEAFSDGVIAVIITIMVLDLKAPADDRLASLLELWPSFLCYAISFVYVAIYWINHHALLAPAKRVTPALMWSNNALLFFLSLFPFATAYMAATRISPFATMIYGVLQLMCAAAFGLLHMVIVRQYKDDPTWRKEAEGAIWKGRASRTLYALAVPAAYINPFISIAIFVIVAVVYTVPDLLARRTS